MTKESNPNQNRVIEAALEYGRAQFQMKAAAIKLQTFFPNLQLNEIELMVDTIESAASGSLRRPVKTTFKPVRDVAIDSFKGLEVVEVVKKTKPGRKRDQAERLREVIATALVKGPLHVRDIQGEITQKKFPLKSKDPNAYILYVLRSSPTFKRVGKGLFALATDTAKEVVRKGAKKKRVQKAKTSSEPLKAKTKPKAKAKPKPLVGTNEVVNYLVSHSKPVTGPELVKHFKLKNLRPLTTILFNLKKRGGIEDKDGVWEPVLKVLKTIKEEGAAAQA
jgi:hypothetical protein